jgi:hypothetical protein
MRRISATIVLLGAFLDAPAWALRGVEPGASCDLAERIELQLGSNRLGSRPKNSDTPDRIFFDGKHLGHDVVISYSCRAEVVDSQIITAKLTHEHEARLTFAEFKGAVVAEYGDARKDADEPAISAMQDGPYQIGSPVHRFVSWVVGERVLSLMLSGEADSWVLSLHGP